MASSSEECVDDTLEKQVEDGTSKVDSDVTEALKKTHSTGSKVIESSKRKEMDASVSEDEKRTTDSEDSTEDILSKKIKVEKIPPTPTATSNESIESSGLLEDVNTSTAGSSIKKDVISYINQVYTNREFINSLSRAFVSKTMHSFDNGAKLLTDPFTCCILPKFLLPDWNVSHLKEEVSELDVGLKLNDLYQFKQSTDLKNCESPNIAAFRKILHSRFCRWLQNVTKIQLSSKIDMFCSCYTFTDHLLCHDDELEGRRIAYIYYLVNDWKKEDGGSLDLFKTENGQPTAISTSIVPFSNTLIFFEVSPLSYHQVSEILAFKSRISISGWFYGPSLKAQRISYKEFQLFSHPSDSEIELCSWINPTYLDYDTQLEIADSFEESSEIELEDFLQEDKYNAVREAFLQSNLNWKTIGPANRRKYEELSHLEDIPTILGDLHKLFTSELFVLVLANMTGLRLHPDGTKGSSGMAQVTSVMRRWSPASYTLLHDGSFPTRAIVNATLCFNCEGWKEESGGYTSYVAEDESEELLRIDPKANSLALVYCTSGTSHFVKYINCRAEKQESSSFQDIYCEYREVEE